MHDTPKQSQRCLWLLPLMPFQNEHPTETKWGRERETETEREREQCHTRNIQERQDEAERGREREIERERERKRDTQRKTWIQASLTQEEERVTWRYKGETFKDKNWSNQVWYRKRRGWDGGGRERYSKRDMDPSKFHTRKRRGDLEV